MARLIIDIIHTRIQNIFLFIIFPLIFGSIFKLCQPFLQIYFDFLFYFLYYYDTIFLIEFNFLLTFFTKRRKSCAMILEMFIKKYVSQKV